MPNFPVFLKKKEFINDREYKEAHFQEFNVFDKSLDNFILSQVFDSTFYVFKHFQHSYVTFLV